MNRAWVRAELHESVFNESEFREESAFYVRARVMEKERERIIKGEIDREKEGERERDKLYYNNKNKWGRKRDG